MKKILMAFTALAVVFTGTAASAQNHNQDRNGRGSYNQNHGGDRGDRRDHRDNRRGYNDRRDHRENHGRYARGQRFRGDGAYMSDYGRYGYRAPPRGYRYYRTNQGDVVLAAIAGGLIASVIAGNNHR